MTHDNTDMSDNKT